MDIKFKRLLSGRVKSIIAGMGAQVVVRDVQGRVLYENPAAKERENRHPVELGGKLIGWVSGDEMASAVAMLLSHLAGLELEKKALGRETLEKYKETALLYEMTEKLSATMEPKDVAQLVAHEAGRLIKGDSFSVMVINEETGLLDYIFASGSDSARKLSLRVGEGVAGHIALTGRAEIVNNAPSDPRYVEGELPIKSMMCAPLKIKDKVIGIINVSSQKQLHYASGDLKILIAISSQAAVAIENAKLSYIRETFGRYLSDDVVSRLLANPGALQLGGEKKQITIMMSDLRGFTSLSELLSPEIVVAMLNNYLRAMVDVIQKYHGTILEFIGDSIMVIFGAPLWVENHASMAVSCAIEMQLAMEEVNRWNLDNGYPEIEMGIGINTGHVIVGNIGSEKRTKYGCVGSRVNLTARIESYSVGGQILVSEETREAVGLSLKINNSFQVHPKGLKDPVTIFEIGGVGEPYNLYLTEQLSMMIPLSDYIPVQVVLLEDKHFVGDSIRGFITGLSAREAELLVEKEIPGYSSVKIQVSSQDGTVMADDIYAKTKTDPGKEDSGTVVQFTSISQDGKILFSRLLQGNSPEVAAEPPGRWAKEDN